MDYTHRSVNVVLRFEPVRIIFLLLSEQMSNIARSSILPAARLKLSKSVIKA